MIDYHVQGSVCVLRLNTPPLNTITPALLDSLRAALRRAAADAAVRGIVLTGGPEHFSAGADVNLFREIRTADDAIRISQVFQDACQMVEDCPKPVAAALAGTVFGGGLELAVACHFRVAAGTCRFRMPEVTLGVNPGSGGTQRLPRLLGVEAALKMMLTAQTLDAHGAWELGLVDVVCPGGELVEQAGALLRSATVSRKTCARIEMVQDPAANAAAFRWAEKIIASVRPELVAPRKIFDAVKTGLEVSLQAGMLKEREVFAECLATPATKNKIRLFFAIRQTGKLPELEGVMPLPVAKSRPEKVIDASSAQHPPPATRHPPPFPAAVVGLGTMGSGIAQALVAAGIPVVALDQSPSALAKGIERIHSSLQRRVGQGKMSQQQADATLGRISAVARWEDLAGADLVVEAVFEDAQAKRAVFERLEEVCRPDCIFATNTSTIPLNVLAAGMRHPERLVGLHFFHPAQTMPLVEVIRRQVTPPHVLATAVKLTKSLGKTPVVVQDREGFLVTRVFVPYLQEAFWLLEEGAAPAEIDSAAVDFGFPMGPLELIDMSGLDILVESHRVLAAAFGWHGPLSGVVAGLVERGHLGQKSGAGVYRYEPGDKTPRENPATAAAVGEARRAAARRAPTEGWSRAVSRPEIAERLVMRMVSEAFHVLEEGIVRSAADLDVAMVLGIGFPDFRGGPLKYAEDLGFGLVCAGLREWAGRCGPRFEPCELLRKTRGVL